MNCRGGASLRMFLALLVAGSPASALAGVEPAAEEACAAQSEERLEPCYGPIRRQLEAMALAGVDQAPSSVPWQSVSRSQLGQYGGSRLPAHRLQVESATQSSQAPGPRRSARGLLLVAGVILVAAVVVCVADDGFLC